LSCPEASTVSVPLLELEAAAPLELEAAALLELAPPVPAV
jgi:hypothetical protein